MLALTKKTGYGLIAMAHLAELPQGRVCSAREIAETYEIPTAMLMNVLKSLAASGYVASFRGVRGGYRLARQPEEINLAELVGAIEGPVPQAECIAAVSGDDQECTCQVMARCPVADPVHRVQRKLRDFLRKVTLAEITAPALAGR
ncbi:MAG: Rrf2 family transcriptional regulator [Phycisphaerae bacterium]|nr:Rrf2 family transcriptional regulator [Phycisphaerae bacterium]